MAQQQQQYTVEWGAMGKQDSPPSVYNYELGETTLASARLVGKKVKCKVALRAAIPAQATQPSSVTAVLSPIAEGDSEKLEGAVRYVLKSVKDGVAHLDLIFNELTSKMSKKKKRQRPFVVTFTWQADDGTAITSVSTGPIIVIARVKGTIAGRQALGIEESPKRKRAASDSSGGKEKRAHVAEEEAPPPPPPIHADYIPWESMEHVVPWGVLNSPRIFDPQQLAADATEEQSLRGEVVALTRELRATQQQLSALQEQVQQLLAERQQQQ